MIITFMFWKNSIQFAFERCVIYAFFSIYLCTICLHQIHDFFILSMINLIFKKQPIQIRVFK